MKRACNGFAVGGIEAVTADGASCIVHIDRMCVRSTKQFMMKKKRNQFFRK
jgi:hypothetical protein